MRSKQSFVLCPVETMRKEHVPFTLVLLCCLFSAESVKAERIPSPESGAPAISDMSDGSLWPGEGTDDDLEHGESESESEVFNDEESIVEWIEIPEITILPAPQPGETFPMIGPILPPFVFFDNVWDAEQNPIGDLAASIVESGPIHPTSQPVNFPSGDPADFGAGQEGHEEYQQTPFPSPASPESPGEGSVPNEVVSGDEVVGPGSESETSPQESPLSGEFDAPEEAIEMHPSLLPSPIESPGEGGGEENHHPEADPMPAPTDAGVDGENGDSGEEPTGANPNHPLPTPIAGPDDGNESDDGESSQVPAGDHDVPSTEQSVGGEEIKDEEISIVIEPDASPSPTVTPAEAGELGPTGDSEISPGASPTEPPYYGEDGYFEEESGEVSPTPFPTPTYSPENGSESTGVEEAHYAGPEASPTEPPGDESGVTEDNSSEESTEPSPTATPTPSPTPEEEPETDEEVEEDEDDCPPVDDQIADEEIDESVESEDFEFVAVYEEE